jgi:hypothetical protein
MPSEFRKLFLGIYVAMWTQLNLYIRHLTKELATLPSDESGQGTPEAILSELKERRAVLTKLICAACAAEYADRGREPPCEVCAFLGRDEIVISQEAKQEAIA